MVTTVERGNWGESLAVDYLRDAGWEVLERNWRCEAGEIDVIARDGATLVFVEVKTRTSTMFGWPAEAVTARKRQRLRRLVARYLEGTSGTDQIRIDVIGILAPQDAAPTFAHYRGVQ